MAAGAPHAGASGAPAAAPPAIWARGLIAAHGLTPVIRDLDLDIPAGTTVALLGGNGTGKSTLLRLLAGLRSPRRGELAVLGHPLPADRWAIRGKVGVVAHHPLLYRELTIAENLTYHARLHRLPPERVEEVLDLAELRERAGQPVGASPAASCSAPPSPGRCSPTLRCCCSMSRSPTSTRWSRSSSAASSARARGAPA